MPEYRSASGSAAEDLFIDLFCGYLRGRKSRVSVFTVPVLRHLSKCPLCRLRSGKRRDPRRHRDRRRGLPQSAVGVSGQILRRSAEAKQYDSPGLGRVPLGCPTDAEAAGDREG